jgi:hypothetical protein
MAIGAERLIEGPDAIDAMHDLAYLNMVDATTPHSFRLGLIAMTAAEGDKTVSDAVSRSTRNSFSPGKRSTPPSSRHAACNCGPGSSHRTNSTSGDRAPGADRGLWVDSTR